jgi:riboflavin transporter FmnP
MPATDNQRWEAKQLALMALFTAVGLILSFIELPILPGTTFLKYDAAPVAAMIAGFTFGPAVGCLVGIVISAIHGLFTGNLVGAVMNICVMAVFILPPTFFYKYGASIPRVLVGLVLGAILAIGAALLLNLIILPYWPGLPINTVIAMIPTALLPFNVIKMSLNAVLSFILWRALRRPLDI